MEDQRSSQTPSHQQYAGFRVLLAIVITLMISVPVTLLGFSWFMEEIKGALATAALVSVGVLCLGLLVGRDWIFKKIGMATQTALDSMIAPAADSIVHFAKGDLGKASEEVATFVKRGAARYAWIQSYRTMLGLIGWLFLSFAGLAGSAILIRQNELTEQTLIAVNKQTERITEQVKLLRTQTRAADEQVQLLKAQNRIADSQNSLLESQNALSEAARRAFTAAELSSILDRVSLEIQQATKLETVVLEIDKSSYSDFLTIELELLVRSMTPQPNLSPKTILAETAKTQRKTMQILLTKPLYGRIEALSSTLRPYKFYGETNKLVGPLSPERAQLYDVLTSSDISLGPLSHSLDLSFADFRQRDLRGKTFVAAELQNADFSNSKMFRVHFHRCDLTGASFQGVDLNSCSFVQCKMPVSDSFAGATHRNWGHVKSFTFEPAQFDDSTPCLFFKCFYPQSDWHKGIGIEGSLRYRETIPSTMPPAMQGIALRAFSIYSGLFEVYRDTVVPNKVTPF